MNKSILLLITSLLAACGNLDNAKSIEYSPQSERSEWVYMGGPALTASYILTIDSVQYIVVSNGKGITMSFHKSLKENEIHNR